MITDTLNNAVARVEARLADIDAEALARVEASATLTEQDWFALGETASRALLNGIPADIAQDMYALHRRFHTATLAERVVYMQLVVEIGRR